MNVSVGPLPPGTRTARTRWARRLLGAAAILVLALLIVAGAAFAWVRVQLGRSLPQLDGERQLAGLSAQVTVERDGFGVPTLAGASRRDLARALGFVHAQDRFFQMDLARRRAAGELAELFGPVAVPVDRASRLHRFRARAVDSLREAAPDDRTLVESYAAGVNAGLAALRAVPFEYLLLRAEPRPWRPEDSILVLASMFFSLQDATASAEGRLALLHATFPAPLADFLNATASQWDTPIEGDRLPPPAIPGPDVFDLRAQPVPRAAEHRAAPPDLVATPSAPRGLVSWLASAVLSADPPDADARGSNNWVVAGAVTADGRPIVANDMHLGISVPNTWYRASLRWSAEDGPHRVTGVTLPGVPPVVVGSNGRVAWGFTNTTADWSDRVLLQLVPGDPTRYLTPAGPRAFDVVEERIRVKGAGDEVLRVRHTIWGPVADPDALGRLFAIAWVAHDPEALNLRLGALERVRSLDEAFEVAGRAGIPAQNLVAADADGNIGWTVAGRIPRRVGFDGRLPSSWADGTRGWQGWYAPDEYPRVVNPAEGRIVTANNRVVGGRGLEMLGDGGYDPGARARQIRDDLRAIPRATVGDMLRVQLDDRAVLMDRWRRLALGVLTPSRATTDARREFRRLLVDGWSGRASVESAGYRLVREFRTRVAELTLAPFVERLRLRDPEYPATPGRALEGSVWALVSQRPPHLLDTKYRDWDALLLAAVDRTVADLTAGDRRLGDRTWGEANVSHVAHALSRGVPWLAWWLDMPHHALPGDSHMPRVQGPTFGASERLAVSPGQEAQGYLHMPAGQSGHPLSPHYRDGHDAWVRGEPTPFLPGSGVSRLVLRP